MSIDVVYLAYYNPDVGYTFDLLENFFISYKTKPAGINHSLTIIAKNWSDKNLYNKLCDLAKKNNAKVLNLPDDGWDFGAYFRAVKELKGDYVLFLGSSIRIVSDNWLRKLYNPFKVDSKTQLVGPMGSWEDLQRKIFPNYHIRTCSFMLKRELFLEYSESQKFPETKEDTYDMEHGSNSITQFILNKGYNAVVVDNDGKIFPPEKWVESKTFRYPYEIKTLFLDKISASYFAYDENFKRVLEKCAWGKTFA